MNKWILPIVMLVSALLIVLMLMLWVLPKTLVIFILGLLMMVTLPLVLLCRQDAFLDDLSEIEPINAKKPPIQR